MEFIYLFIHFCIQAHLSLFKKGCISYNKIWGSEFENNVSKKDKRQNINLNQLKLKVNDAYKKDEETTTKFEPSSDKDVINKAYLDTKISK